MKKIALILGVMLFLVFGILLVIPFVIDVNQYRPQVVEAVNDHMNGKLELGKLSLNLWGGIHVGIDGLELKDQMNNRVVSVKVASFDMPYSSVFSGSPLITLHMVQPEIQVVKSKEGKLNVMNLVKTATAAAEAKPTEPTGKIALPSMALNAHIGVSIENAKLVYKDEAMSLSNTIDQFNLSVKDFSLSRKTEIELWADLKTKMGTDLSVTGPLKLFADLSPEFSGSEFKSATVNANFTADDLEVIKGDLFVKKKGIPANFKFKGSLTQEVLKLSQALMKFHNAEIDVTGEYQQSSGANINFVAKPVDLKPWSELVPMLKEYELEGKVSLKGSAKGTPDKLEYQAAIQADGFSAKGPHLKSKPVVNAEILIATDRIEKFDVAMKAPGNDLKMNGKMISFSKPQLSFAVSSSGMDLDQWIEFPKSASKTGEKSESKAGSSDGAKVDYDAMLEPIRKNEIMKNMQINGLISLAFIKAMNIRIADISAKVEMKNLSAGLTGIKMSMNDGAISGNFTTDLKPSNPTYSMSLSVAGLDMQKAVESQFQSFKNTIVGKLSAGIQGSGSSFNPDEVKKKLQLKGDFKINNAVFQSMDIAKMVNSALGDSLIKIAAKVPALQGKKVNLPSDRQTRYELVSGHFSINGGYLEAPDFYAKAATKSGIDIKGYTKMGLIDEMIDAKWELIDNQHLIEPVNISVAGKTIVNALAKGDKDPLVLPITVGCKWSAPCPSYTSTVEYVSGVAAGRLAKVAGDELKSKAKNVIQDAVKKAIGGDNPLKGLFGR